MKMSKKMCLALGLAIVLGGSTWAEPAAQTASGETGRKNAVSLNFAPLLNGLIAIDTDAKTSMGGIGLSYERFFNPSVSAGAQFAFMAGKATDLKAQYFSAGAFARYYPKLLDRIFFVYTDLGWNMLRYNKETDFAGLTFGCGMGARYTLTIHQQRFFAEATLGYLNAKASADVPFTPSAWEVGLNLGWMF